MARPAMTDTGISRRRREPTWWNDQHSRSWDRVKEAFSQDWPQIRAEFSTTRRYELRPGVTDTVKHAAGRDRIPPRGVVGESEPGYDTAEPALRYGYGASAYYFDHDVWDASLEAKLRDDWSEVDSDEDWKTVRHNVRRGWEYARDIRS